MAASYSLSLTPPEYVYIVVSSAVVKMKDGKKERGIEKTNPDKKLPHKQKEQNTKKKKSFRVGQMVSHRVK